MPDPVLIAKIALTLSLFSGLFMLERRYAALVRNRLYGLRRLFKNMSLWAINAVMSPLVILPLSALAAANALWDAPQNMFIIAAHIVLLDLWIYFWHRANHEWPLLWRFHKTHHMDEALDTTTALRFHFGEVWLSALARAPVIMILAVPLSTIILFEALLLAATLFHHSNWRLRARVNVWLGHLIITPELHRIHHHPTARDTDSNYGTLFSFWDRLFQTRIHYRVKDDHIIGAPPPDNPDLALLPLLSLPFRRQK